MERGVASCGPFLYDSGHPPRLRQFLVAEGELAGLLGSFIPFAETRADREGSGDPRLSLEERYSNIDDYLRQIRAAIESLVQAGLMLPEDTDTLVADCRMAYLDSFGDDSG